MIRQDLVSDPVAGSPGVRVKTVVFGGSNGCLQKKKTCQSDPVFFRHGWISMDLLLALQHSDPPDSTRVEAIATRVEAIATIQILQTLNV